MTDIYDTHYGADGSTMTTLVRKEPLTKWDKLLDGVPRASQEELSAIRSLEAAHIATIRVVLQAQKDAKTLGAGFIRVNPDGSFNLLDPCSVAIKDPAK